MRDDSLPVNAAFTLNDCAPNWYALFLLKS